MENNNLTMAHFAKQIDKYFVAFKAYCNTFNIDLFHDRFFPDPNNEELSSDREINQELINHFKPKKDKILEYRYDYYTLKSIKEIADITGAEPSRIVSYLERIKHQGISSCIFSGLSKYGDVTLKTRVIHISSYQILKDFQTQERQLILQKKIKERELRNSQT
jgi:hypothetical protein